MSNHPFAHQYKVVTFLGVRFGCWGDFDVEFGSNDVEEPSGVDRTRAGIFFGVERFRGTAGVDVAKVISDMRSVKCGRPSFGVDVSMCCFDEDRSMFCFDEDRSKPEASETETKIWQWLNKVEEFKLNYQEILARHIWIWKIYLTCCHFNIL